MLIVGILCYIAHTMSTRSISPVGIYRYILPTILAVYVIYSEYILFRDFTLLITSTSEFPTVGSTAGIQYYSESISLEYAGCIISRLDTLDIF